jgi:hypothetical protein
LSKPKLIKSCRAEEEEEDIELENHYRDKIWIKV